MSYMRFYAAGCSGACVVCVCGVCQEAPRRQGQSRCRPQVEGSAWIRVRPARRSEPWSSGGAAGGNRVKRRAARVPTHACWGGQRRRPAKGSNQEEKPSVSKKWVTGREMRPRNRAFAPQVFHSPERSRVCSVATNVFSPRRRRSREHMQSPHVHTQSLLSNPETCARCAGR